ncbi:MAG: hypothetical protein ACLTBV_17520 [Enterocloster bolteae]
MRKGAGKQSRIRACGLAGKPVIADRFPHMEQVSRRGGRFICHCAVENNPEISLLHEPAETKWPKYLVGKTRKRFQRRSRKQYFMIHMNCLRTNMPKDSYPTLGPVWAYLKRKHEFFRIEFW